MDDLFKVRVLTTAVNALRPPGRKVFQRHFAGRTHMEMSDRLAFEVISGSEEVLAAISVVAPATVTEKTGRKVVTLQAPRLAEKRFIHTSELNALRAYGEQVRVEMMSQRINRELTDMRNKHDRTLEFWAAYALRGQILDADLTTVLVDYNFQSSHKPVLAGADLWTDAQSDPVSDIREWKRLIEDDSGHEVTGWVAWCGWEAMDALLNHSKVRELLQYERGRQMAEEGRIVRLADVEIIEYNASFKDSSGTRQRFIPQDAFILVGEGADVFDCPYAPVVDDDAPGGVGNIGENGQGQLFFSKSWKEEDPSGRWIKVETRPLPVVQRPDAIIFATVV
jgi:hypothetical protein